MVLVDVDVLVELQGAPARFECVWGRGDGVWVAPDAIDADVRKDAAGALRHRVSY